MGVYSHWKLLWIYFPSCIVAPSIEACPQLFGTTIEQNITYGLESYDRQQMIAAAKLANAHVHGVASHRSYLRFPCLGPTSEVRKMSRCSPPHSRKHIMHFAAAGWVGENTWPGTLLKTKEHSKWEETEDLAVHTSCGGGPQAKKGSGTRQRRPVAWISS